MSAAGRRVVVTGIGAVTPIGCGAAGLWRGVLAGRSAGRRLTRFDPTPFPSQVAAEVDHLDTHDVIEPKRARWLDRFAQLAIVASHQALVDSGWTPPAGAVPDRRTAVYLGSALGGLAYAEEQHEQYLRSALRGGEVGLRDVSPSLALSVFGGAGAANVGIHFGFRGPSGAPANSCAAGAVAIGDALRLIRCGAADRALAGGVEAPLAPLTFGSFTRIRALTTRSDEPERASRPFDRDRDGFLMAEGAAVLVLEALDYALERGARPYAEVLGYATTNDAYHMTAPLPEGEEAARAMTEALGDASVAPEQVGYVNAHATATPIGDVAEAKAMHLAFGQHATRVPVSATKGLHGHALGASGAIEAAITALALRHGHAPAGVNLDDPDPRCDLAFVEPGGASLPTDIAMTNSFGFGGTNASLILRRWDG